MNSVTFGSPRIAATLLGVSLLATLTVLDLGTVPANAGVANCTQSVNPQNVGQWSKNGMKAYAAGAINEGYVYGGACWSDNDDGLGPNHPALPTHDPSEGPDCSALVGKGWGLAPSYGVDPTFYIWPTNYSLHPGGVYTGALMTSSNSSWYAITVSQRTFMDAFVRSDASVAHTGLLIAATSTDGSSNTTLEARSSTLGTGYWYARDLRSYVWRARRNWGTWP
jgi:hypothetical protein